MSIYKDLDISIQLISRNKSEYDYFKGLITAHLEGKHVYEDMPDVLRVVLKEWEDQQHIRY